MTKDSKMKDKQKPKKSSPNAVRQSTSRPTIGFITHGMADEFGAALWDGATDAAREQDANLICFPGQAMHSPVGFESQANTLYDLVNVERVDGVMISATVSIFMEPEDVLNFWNRYQDIPIVNTGQAMEGIPSVIVDNKSGMRDLIVHLIEVHGYRRIAFIRGAEGSPDTLERYQVYVDVLTDYDIELDPNLVMPGEYQFSSGVDAINGLLDERQAEFEAVVACDDIMAIGALHALQERGIRVPDDVAIVGFDDVESGWYTTPPLTTVRYPAYESTKRSVEMVLALLAGENVPEQVILPTEMVVRQSCGCLDPAVIQAAAEPMTALSKENSTAETLEAAFASQREFILSEMVQVMAKSPDDATWVNRLLAAFSAEVIDESPGTFLSALDEILRQVLATGGNVASWHRVISMLRHYALPSLSNSNGVLSQAENLWQQARVMIGEMTQRAMGMQQLQVNQQAQLMREISNGLMTAFRMAHLMDALAQELPRLEIASCYLALYEGQEVPAEWSRLLLAYNERGRVEREVGEQRFLSHQLVPDNLLPDDRRYTMVVQSLYFREEPLGFILFEEGLQDGIIYEVLQNQISSALKGILERKRAEAILAKRAAELQTVAEVSTTTSTIRETEKLLQEVVEMTKNNFDLYHAHIFLLDISGQNLVITASTGEAGQELVEEGLTIPIAQEQSLVAQVGRTRQGILINNVFELPDYLPHRLLPDTRAELTVPIVVGEKLIGVMDVQSDKVNSFTEEDIYIQTSLAAQVAIAIENARLFEQSQKAIDDLNEITHRLTREGWQEYLQTTEVAKMGYVYDLGQVSSMAEMGEDTADAEIHGENGNVLMQSLAVHGEPIGRLAIINDPDAGDEFREIDEETAEIMAAVAEQLSARIENLRLTEATQTVLAMTEQQAHRLVVLNEMGTALSAAPSEVEIFKITGKYALDILDGDRASIAMFDQSGDFVEIFALSGQEGLIPTGTQMPVAESAFSAVLKENGPVRFDELAMADFASTRKLAEEGIRNTMSIPLAMGGQIMGIMNVGSKTPGTYDENSESLMNQIASLLVSNLENRRLIEQTQARAAELQTVADVSTAAASTLDTQKLLQEVVDLTRSSFNLYHAHVYLVDEQMDNDLVLTAGAGEVGQQMVADGRRIPMNQEQSLVARAARSREGVIVNEVQADSGFLPHPSLPDTRAELAVPMIAGDRLMGVLDVQAAQVNYFAEADARIQMTLATQIAVALQNAQLFEDTQRAGFLLGERVKELNCLNDIGHKIEETPPIPEFLQWVTERIPPAMQVPDICIAAITLDNEVYGIAAAIDTPRHIVEGLRVSGERVGRIYIAYTEKRDFIDEESALIGGIGSRVSSYVESQRLSERVQLLAAIVENHPDFIGVGTLEGQAIYVNPAGLHMAGLPSDFDVTIMNARNFYPEEDAELLTEVGIPTAIQVGSWSAEANMLKSDGSMIPVEETIGINYDANNNPVSFSMTMHDITERKQADEALSSALAETEAQAHRLALLNDMSAALNAATGMDEIFKIVGSNILNIISSDWASIAMLDPGEDTFGILALQGEPGDIPVGTHLPVEGTAIGLAIHENRTIRLPKDMPLDDFVDTRQLVEQGLRSTLVAPLAASGNVIGTLNLGSRQPYAFTSTDMNLIQQIVNLLASTIESQRLFEQAQISAEQERRVRTITDKIRRGVDREAILRVAREEISELLGASKSTARLGTQTQLLSRLRRSVAQNDEN